MLPKRWLLQNELALRKLLALRYSGQKHLCNVCGKGLSQFVLLATNDLLCPFCGSLPRNRRLWQVLNKQGVTGAVLDFSPSRCLYREMTKKGDVDYVSTDFAGEFEAQQSYDITDIPEPDSRFDWVVCYHVLEHVEDDQKAMSELFRVLKNGGKAIVQTPFKDGDIFEDTTIRTPKERLKYFGQEDHVRIYSVHGLKSRLEQVGFTVRVLEFDEPHDKLGLKESETILIASK